MDVTNLTNFTEKATDLLVTNVLLNNDIQRYDFYDDVQGTEYINYIDVTLFEQSQLCTLENSGTTTWDQKIITTYPIAFAKDYCWTELYPKAIRVERMNVAKGLEDSSFAKTFTDEHIVQVKSKLERDMWVSSISLGDKTNGFATLAYAASDRLKVDADLVYPQSGLTGTIVNNIVKNIISKANLKPSLWAAANEKGQTIVIHVAQNIYNLYRDWLADNDNNRITNVNLTGNEIFVPGYENLVSVKQEPKLFVDDQTENPIIVATYDKNLIVASSMISEITAPKIQWVSDQLTDKVWFKAAYRLGMLIKFTDEVITYE
jgi:hypothetical protein